MFSFFKKERAARAAEAAKAAAEAAAWRAGEAERNRAAAQLRAAYAAQQSATPQHDAHVQKYRTHKALQQVIQRMRESAREYRVAKYREASATSVDYRTEATEPPFEHGPLKKGLPKPYTVGVYMLLNDEEKVLYVGQSKSCIRSRIEIHRKNKEFTRVQYIPCDERMVDACETVLMKIFCPLYNRADGPASPYLGEIAEAEMPNDEEGTIG